MIENIIAIYPGRFQPMGKHHAEAFRWLQKQVGISDFYIATSNKVELPNSPFSFHEKKEIINAHGFKNVIMTKNPYGVNEISDLFDPDTTAVIFMVGEKDMKDNPRFSVGYTKKGAATYYQTYSSNDKLLPFSKHAYLLTAPHFSLNVRNFGEISGTQIREVFQMFSNKPQEEKDKIFYEVMGFNNPKIEKMIFDRLSVVQEECLIRDIIKLLL